MYAILNQMVEDDNVDRKLSNQRALRIMAAAREEFASRGLSGARVERVARRANVNKQLLFYYFRSKRGLFETVLDGAIAELEQALAAATVPNGRVLDRLRGTLESQFNFLARNPNLVTLLSHAERPDAATPPYAPAIRRLVVLLAEGQGLGQVRDDLDPHIAAAQALVLMIGYLRLEPLIAASTPPFGADEPTLRERWRRSAVDLVVNGVRAGSAEGT